MSGYRTDHIAYLGLGSNLDSPLEHVVLCVRELSDATGIAVLKCSSLYRSAPQGFLYQPDYINAVVEVRTTLSPVELLKALKVIEGMHRRTRSFRNAPRTLDIDILLYEQLQLSSVDLVVPHPRAYQRAFVLKPLVEIMPEIFIPGYGRADALLAQCRDQPVTLLCSMNSLPMPTDSAGSAMAATEPNASPHVAPSSPFTSLQRRRSVRP